MIRAINAEGGSCEPPSEVINDEDGSLEPQSEVIRAINAEDSPCMFAHPRL